MSSSEELATSIQWLLQRYRHRLVTRTGLVGLLSLGCVSALVWRLWLAKTPPAGLFGIGLVGLLALGGWQWLAWRRERLSTNTVALDLDRTLDLHARLITATELAQEPNPPALYPRLLQETHEALASASAQLPRVADRRVAGLSAALLLLLLWRSHPVASLTQFAKHIPPQPQPQQLLPQPPERQDTEAQSPRDQQQQAASAQRESKQGADQPQPSESASSSSKESSASTSGSQASSQQQPSSERPSDTKEEGGGQGTDQRSKGSPQRSEADKDRASDRRPSSPDSSERQPASDQKRAASQSTRDQRPDRRAGQTGASSTSQRNGTTERQQRASASTQGAQMSEGSSSKDQLAQDALKVEIQQLLKQLSEELQSLQAHVTEQRLERPHPAPGTSTDPKLYDDADVSPQADASQRRLPIQMTVDQQMAASRRPAGGVGEPSDDVAAQTPQQLEEEAQLSTQAADAEAVKRHAIPPEYQPVFDRLSSQPQEPSRP